MQHDSYKHNYFNFSFWCCNSCTKGNTISYRKKKVIIKGPLEAMYLFNTTATISFPKS